MKRSRAPVDRRRRPFGVRRSARLAVLCLIVSAFDRTGASQAPLPDLTAPVNDFAGVIDADQERRIDQLSRSLQAATGDVVVVVTVGTVAPYADVREYAIRLFENHGRGLGERGRDNGLLILLALEERRVWIEVGYGLEQWITDGFAGETSRDHMAPEFRDGRCGAGLLAGAARIIGRIAERRDVTLTGVELPAERQMPGLPIPLPLIIGIFLVIVWLGRSLGGPRRGVRRWGQSGWSGWSSGVGPFGGGAWTRGGGDLAAEASEGDSADSEGDVPAAEAAGRAGSARREKVRS